ncbi:DUF6428 family protein [Lewinella sp. W8]|uniref:DUF6428 family protein n=1 Tax=Lewinella sp. W8 TaxID=2528208 RepID=UPI001068A6DD|nr:DUF6428 family protein [Lewinella sp. W8]MTB50448.1 hypothetical protein [Lewinella sp. W8]
MRLSELKTYLAGQETIAIALPNGEEVPAHFHVTEVGESTKHFIDCGGTMRHEKKVNLQLWSANDYDHRLHPEKLVHILSLAESKLGLGDLDVEVEYQGADAIVKYGLDVRDNRLQLTGTQTDCLAKADCGIPAAGKKVSLGAFIAGKQEEACTPGGGCC